MKIYIKRQSEYIQSSIVSTRLYQRKKAKTVTTNFVNQCKEFKNLYDSQKKEIIKAISMWKAQHQDIVYHHVNLSNVNTADDTVNNVVLMQGSAHGFLHIPATELKFMRCYDITFPMHPFGPKAEEREQRLYRDIVIDAISPSSIIDYSVQQFVDIINPIIVSNPDASSKEIFDIISSASINYITLEQIKNLLASKSEGVDFNNPPDVIYIDSKTAEEVTNALLYVQQKLDGQMSDYSIESILEYLEENTMQVDEILEYDKQSKIRRTCVESSLDWNAYYARQAQEDAIRNRVHGSEPQIPNDYDLDKLYDVMEDFDWGEYDTPEEKIEAMEDNGYAVADPCTLRAACELIYSYTPDLKEALEQIDVDYGNSIGVFPLCIYDWKEQQDIYRKWYEENTID